MRYKWTRADRIIAKGISIDPDTKKCALDEYLAVAKASDVAERHSIPAQLLYNWRSDHQLQTVGKQHSSSKARHLEQQLWHWDEEIAVPLDLLEETYQAMPVALK